MPKPITGLPDFAMPSTTRLVQPSSMPITTTAATFGLLPVPISVRKWRSRSAPNCRRPYGCGMAIAPLTLCATASAAALDRSSTGSTMTWLRTPTRPFSRRYPWNVFCMVVLLWAARGAAAGRWLPALGLDVVHVRVGAARDRLDHLADVHAVLDDGVAGREVAQRHLVPERDVLRAGQRERTVLVEDEAGESHAGLDPFDDDDGDGVLRVVQHAMDHGGGPGTETM